MLFFIHNDHLTTYNIKICLLFFEYLFHFKLIHIDNIRLSINRYEKRFPDYVKSCINHQLIIHIMNYLKIRLYIMIFIFINKKFIILTSVRQKWHIAGFHHVIIDVRWNWKSGEKTMVIYFLYKCFINHDMI